MGKEGQGGGFGTATTGLSITEWYAVECWATSGGNRKFKRYQYSNTSLATETVTADTANIIAPGTSTALRIGNYHSLGTGLAFNGVIDRVVLLEADPSDADFQSWAETGVIPSGLASLVRFHAILTNTSPTPDLANGNNLTVTGTTYTTDAPPLASDPIYAQSAYRFRANDGSLLAP